MNVFVVQTALVTRASLLLTVTHRKAVAMLNAKTTSTAAESFAHQIPIVAVMAIAASTVLTKGNVATIVSALRAGKELTVLRTSTVAVMCVRLAVV